MCQRKADVPSAVVPSGLVVMAETTTPTDAICYTAPEDDLPSDIRGDCVLIRERTKLDRNALTAISEVIKLTDEEREEIYEFHRKRRRGERIQGQRHAA